MLINCHTKLFMAIKQFAMFVDIAMHSFKKFKSDFDLKYQIVNCHFLLPE